MEPCKDGQLARILSCSLSRVGMGVWVELLPAPETSSKAALQMFLCFLSVEGLTRISPNNAPWLLPFKVPLIGKVVLRPPGSISKLTVLGSIPTAVFPQLIALLHPFPPIAFP